MLSDTDLYRSNSLNLSDWLPPRFCLPSRFRIRWPNGAELCASSSSVLGCSSVLLRCASAPLRYTAEDTVAVNADSASYPHFNVS